MTRLCFVLGAVTFSSVVYAENFGFVGEPVAVEATEYDCKDYSELERGPSGEEAICLDRVFKLRYKNVKAYSEPISGPYVEFFARYHYSGLPDFTRIDPAFIVLKRIGGNLVMEHLYPAEQQEARWVACVNTDETGSCITREAVEDVLRKGEH